MLESSGACTTATRGVLELFCVCDSEVYMSKLRVCWNDVGMYLSDVLVCVTAGDCKREVFLPIKICDCNCLQEKKR